MTQPIPSDGGCAVAKSSHAEFAAPRGGIVTIGRRVRVAVCGLALVALVGCGRAERSRSQVDAVEDRCQRAIDGDDRIAGQAELGVVSDANTADVTTCTVELRAGSDGLAKLGVTTDCEPAASILVAIRAPNNDRVSVDRQKTERLDNGECTLTFTAFRSLGSRP